MEALDKDKRVYATTVKEKFGSLRFYWGVHYTAEEYAALTGEPDSCLPDGPDMDAVDALVDKAEEDSVHICELCGKPGKLRDDSGYLQTLCDMHWERQRRGRL